jgi:integrase
MPHYPKPFFKPKRNTWYVEVERVQHLLGKHPEGIPPPQKRGTEWIAPREILDAYHTKMADLQQQAAFPDVASDAPPAVASVLDEFIGWLQGRVAEGSKAPRTLGWYTKYLTSFLEFLRSEERGSRELPSLTADQLQPLHIYRWADSHTDWKSGKRGAMTAVQRAFNWAAKAGLLKALGGRSPLVGLEKPPQGRRDQLVSPEEYADILSWVKDKRFSDLLESSWDTGARPNELFTVEARFVDLANARWVFPIKESKGKKVQRVVYLTDRVLEITRRLMVENPTGPMFRNSDGKPWCVSSVKCRFQRFRDELGRRKLVALGLMPPKLKMLTVAQRQVPGARETHRRAVLQRRKQVKALAKQHGTKYSLYAFRHAWCTSALESGELDAVTVSVLMGHKDTTMISRTYSHLTQRKDHLRDAARKARPA